MKKIQELKTKIQGLRLFERDAFKDERGYFSEIYNKKEISTMGLRKEFVQDNLSFSTKGVLRGLHFQIEVPQAKLVTVISGRVFDVAVDLRADSDTFGEYEGFELSEHNHKILYIPEGFAHGFLVLSKNARFYYKVSEFYDHNYDRGLRWNDPNVNIIWVLSEIGTTSPIISTRDKQLPSLVHLLESEVLPLQSEK